MNPEWGPIYNKVSTTAQGLIKPSSLRDSTFGTIAAEHRSCNWSMQVDWWLQSCAVFGHSFSGVSWHMPQKWSQFNYMTRSWWPRHEIVSVTLHIRLHMFSFPRVSIIRYTKPYRKLHVFISGQEQKAPIENFVTICEISQIIRYSITDFRASVRKLTTSVESWNSELTLWDTRQTTLTIIILFGI